MEENQTPAPSEAGAEAVAEEAKVEDAATDEASSEEGQVETPPAGEADKSAEPEKSKSQLRRERRRAREAEAAAELERTKAREERMRKTLQGIQAPKAEDYDDEFELTAARAAYKMAVQQREGEISLVSEDRERLEEAQKQAIQEDWTQQVAEAKERFPDFEAKVYGEGAVFSDAMADAIQTSEMGAEVAYHLASNRDEALRIAQMTPEAARRAIYRLEGRLEASPAAQQPKTKAPPPIEPISGAGASSTVDPSKMSMAEYRAWRMGGG